MARRPDVDQVVGVVRQVVDHGALGRLVGDEPRLESRLLEQERQAAAAVELLVFSGRDRREDERHAFVRRIALRQHVAENDQVLDLREARIGFAVVTVELPVHRARRLADDVDVDFAPGRLLHADRTERKAGRGAFEIGRLAEFAGAQPGVVDHVQREDLVPEHVLVLARAVGGPQRQQPQPEEDRPAERDVDTGRARDVALVPDLPGREPQQRQVHRADQNDRRVDVAEQLGRFTRIGGHQVGEHVGGDDRVAEQVEQHDLECAEEDERESQPDHHARPSERDAPHHVEAQRHENQRLHGPDGIRLGVGQHAVGDDQRREEIDRQKSREPAPRAELPQTASMAVRGSIVVHRRQNASLILSRNPPVFRPKP